MSNRTSGLRLLQFNLLLFFKTIQLINEEDQLWYTGKSIIFFSSLDQRTDQIFLLTQLTLNDIRFKKEFNLKPAIRIDMKICSSINGKKSFLIGSF